MASEPKKKKETFLEWKGREDFDYEVDEDDDIVLVKCKICTVYINEIGKEGNARNIRGNVLTGLLNLVDGVNGAHKGNFLQHIKANGLHDWAKKKFTKTSNEVVDAETAGPSGTNQQSGKKKQCSLEESAIKNLVVRENYWRLLCTALFITLKERPLVDFSDLINLQKKNGLTFFEGKNHVNACGDFIDYLVDT